MVSCQVSIHYIPQGRGPKMVVNFTFTGGGGGEKSNKLLLFQNYFI